MNETPEAETLATNPLPTGEGLSVDEGAAVINSLLSDGAETPEPESFESEESPEPSVDESYSDADVEVVIGTQAQVLIQEAETLQQAEQALSELQKTDPAKYQELKPVYDQRLNTFNQAREQVVGDYKETEFRKLRKAIPAWKNPDAMQKGLLEVTGYLVTQGYNANQLNSMTARDIKIAHKAMTQKAPEAKPHRALPKKVKQTKENVLGLELKARNIRDPHSLQAAALRIEGLI